MSTANATPVSSQMVYDIDPAHSAAHFSVRHMMISNVRGEFTKVSGTVTYDPQNAAASKIEAVIDARSINTREPDRDTHLRSADFLDVEKFADIRFESTKVEKHGSGLSVKGNLTIHGVAKEVTLNVTDITEPVKDPWGGTRIGATAATKISRKDFGLQWNMALEAGGFMVGDEVKIDIEVELKQRNS